MILNNLLRNDAPAYIETPKCLKSNADTLYSPCYVCKILHKHQSILSIVSLLDYNNLNSKITPHESVNKKKVRDYVNQFSAGNDLINPILAFYKNYPELQSFLSQLIHSKKPDVTHHVNETIYEIWSINDIQILSNIQHHLQRIKNFYVADGHHRIAALSKFWNQNLLSVPKRYLSLIVPENELDLTSFNRFICNTIFDYPRLLEKLGQIYTIKKVSPNSLTIQSDIYLYGDNTWYKLEQKEPPESKLCIFPAIHLDGLIHSELNFIDSSGFDNFLYLPQTNNVNDIINFYNSYNCKLAISIPKNSLSDFYKITETGELLPPHSTYFTPKIPNGLFIQRLSFPKT